MVCLRFLHVIIFSIIYLVIIENLTINKIKRRRLIYIVINSMAFYAIFHYKMKILLVPTSIVIIFHLIYYNSKRFKYALFVSILANLVFAISEVTATLFVAIIFNIHIKGITEFSLYNTMILFPFLMIAFIISRIIRKILNRVDKSKYENRNTFKVRSNIIFYSIFALATIYINVILFVYFYEHVTIKFFIVNGFTMLCNLLIVILLIYHNYAYVEIRLKQKYKDMEFQQLQEYISNIEKISDDLRKFKHDYLNIFSAIGTYIETNDIEGLEKFYKEDLLPESKKIISNDVTLYLLKNMKINSLKGLISSKIVSANFNDIKTNMEIFDEINSTNISEIDICRIIGIFFDNAIEAAVLCDDKIIDFAVIKSENDTTFIIRNTCPLDVPPIYKLKEKGFSTKGNNRGLGLAIVDDIINRKYTNLSLRTKSEEGMFTQELVITN